MLVSNFVAFSLALIAVAPLVFAVDVPVRIEPVYARNGIVVAGHPQAAEVGRMVLQAGGNAIDAAVSTSLALGVAEPYASGLGGKLMLLYYEAATHRIFVVDAMDEAGGLDVQAYLRRPVEDRTFGFGSVCVPGLTAGLWAAHRRWGRRIWADDVQPAISLARAGARVLPKTRSLIEEQKDKLRHGNADIARCFLFDGKPPEIGTLLANPDLAQTLERIARDGRDGFYRGEVGARLAQALRQGGGVIDAADLASYQARIAEPIEIDFRGYRLAGAPPPASGAALLFTLLKLLENDDFGGGPLRRATNLDNLGSYWRLAEPKVRKLVGDRPESRAGVEGLLSPASIDAIRHDAVMNSPALKGLSVGPANLRHGTRGTGFRVEDAAAASTTHFVIVDAWGDIVCATQSLSFHFGAGVIAPGTGVVLNDSMSNFVFDDPGNPNFVAPHVRPQSDMAPVLVLRDGRPVLALGAPGGGRIVTAVLQVLLDHLVLDRPLAEAIGDTRFSFVATGGTENGGFEAEKSLPDAEVVAMRRFGWKLELPESAGTGRRFGGVNAVEINSDGTLTGFADPRRTNAADGY
ncbi:MAG TPA: gamma-glutamyltransferase [Opitutus sp.]|nr:gamma-glutamyltransferase [Opitutus sp.]